MATTHSTPSPVDATETNGNVIVCKTWEQYYELLKKHFPNAKKDHRGIPEYNHAEVRKICLPPYETR